MQVAIQCIYADIHVRNTSAMHNIVETLTSDWWLVTTAVMRWSSGVVQTAVLSKATTSIFKHLVIIR